MNNSEVEESSNESKKKKERKKGKKKPSIKNKIRIGVIISVITVALFASVAVAYYANNKITLVRPMLSVPVITTPEEQFTVEIEAENDLQLRSLQFKIESPVGNFDLGITSFTVEGNKLSATVNLPSNVLEEILYDLRVTVNGVEDFQPNAVKVINAYNPNLKIIHWSDPQIDLYDKDDKHNTIPHMKSVANEINLVHPDLVIITGDLTEWARPDEFELIYNTIDALDVPVYCISGNHDKYTPSEFVKYFRHFDYSFDYGPNHHFIALDTGINLDSLSDGTYNFLKTDLEENKNVSNKYIAMHAPPFKVGANRNFEYHREDFIQACKDYDVSAVFDGHVHKDLVQGLNGDDLPFTTNLTDTIVLTTNDGREDNAYRLITFTANKISRYSEKISASTWDQKKSLTANSLNLSYAQKNDGSLASVKAIVGNSHKFQNFDSVVVEFNVKSTGIPTIQTSAVYAIQSAYKLVNQPTVYNVKVAVNIVPNNSTQITVVGN
jgi:predicted MPP superfamily phosphohydrolase